MPYDFQNSKFISWFSALERMSEAEYREKKQEYKFGIEASRHFALGVDDMRRPMIGAVGFAHEVFSELDIDSVVMLKKIPFFNNFRVKEYGDYVLFKVNRISDDPAAPLNPFSIYLPAKQGLLDNFYWLDTPSVPKKESKNKISFVQVEPNFYTKDIDLVSDLDDEREYDLFRGGNWTGVATKKINETGVDLRKVYEDNSFEDSLDAELGYDDNESSITHEIDDILDIE